jgi:hypothetical protein
MLASGDAPMHLPEAFELEVGPTAQDDLQTLLAGPDSYDVLRDGVIIAGLARSGETCSAIGTPELLHRVDPAQPVQGLNRQV